MDLCLIVKTTNVSHINPPPASDLATACGHTNASLNQYAASNTVAGGGEHMAAWAIQQLGGAPASKRQGAEDIHSVTALCAAPPHTTSLLTYLPYRLEKARLSVDEPRSTNVGTFIDYKGQKLPHWFKRQLKRVTGPYKALRRHGKSMTMQMGMLAIAPQVCSLRSMW